MFPARNDASVWSGKSGGTEKSRAPLPLVERLAPFIRHVQAKETRTLTLKDSVPHSFTLIHDKLDEIWKDLEGLFKTSPSPLWDPGVSLSLFQGPGANVGPMPSMPTLTLPAFQNLMRQVVDEFISTGFVVQSNLDSRVMSSLPLDTADQLSGLSGQLAGIEKELKDPDGTLSKLEGRIKLLEDRQAGDAIERGGKTFRDLGAVSAWVQTFKDKDLYRYCVDMVTLIMLCVEAYKTIPGGMATAAAAHKAEYNILTEAHISLSYGLTYPENLMKKQDKQKHVAIGGWFWTTSWLTFLAFKGTFNNGTKDAITSALCEVSGMIQNAIDFAFPLNTHPHAHAVFTKQLLLS
jgi:hypothetical protein